MSELAVYDPPATLPARVGVPGTQDFDSWTAVASEVIKLANVIYDTPFVPDGLRSGPAVAAAILAGRELGLGPMTSLANVHVIKGKPALSAVLMRALVLAQGHHWRDVEVTDTRAVIEGRRRTETEWTRVIFTDAQAKQAGIALGGYPQDKLYARATSRLARRKFADVIAGMPYSAEELEDGDAGDAGDAGTVTEPVGDGHAPEKPAPRTARRARAANTPPPAPESPPRDAGAHAPAGGPPLPGEEEVPTSGAGDTAATARVSGGPSSESSAPDETGYDTPGTVTTPQLTAIWTVLRQVFKFTDEEKDQARAVAAHIISRAITSTRQMSRNEGVVILDTLANWQETAKQRGEEPRELLAAYLAAATAQDRAEESQDAAGTGDGDGDG